MCCVIARQNCIFFEVISGIPLLDYSKYLVVTCNVEQAMLFNMSRGQRIVWMCVRVKRYTNSPRQSLLAKKYVRKILFFCALKFEKEIKKEWFPLSRHCSFMFCGDGGDFF